MCFIYQQGDRFCFFFPRIRRSALPLKMAVTRQFKFISHACAEVPLLKMAEISWFDFVPRMRRNASTQYGGDQLIFFSFYACAEVPPLKMAVTSPAVVAHEGSLYVTGGAILEDGDGIELVQR